jgi:hypothetical protein
VFQTAIVFKRLTDNKWLGRLDWIAAGVLDPVTKVREKWGET